MNYKATLIILNKNLWNNDQNIIKNFENVSIFLKVFPIQNRKLKCGYISKFDSSNKCTNKNMIIQ